MGFISVIKQFAHIAFGNPLCDGLENRVLSCQQNIAIQQELLEEEQKLLQEEEELFRKVSGLQKTLLSRIDALDESKNRAVKTLVDDDAQLSGRFDQISEIAEGLVQQIEVNHKDIVDDMAKVDETMAKLNSAKVQLGHAFRSSDKLNNRR